MCTDVNVLVSEVVQSKPEQLCSMSVPAMPDGTEKNDIIFFPDECRRAQTGLETVRLGSAGRQRAAARGRNGGSRW